MKIPWKRVIGLVGAVLAIALMFGGSHAADREAVARTDNSGDLKQYYVAFLNKGTAFAAEPDESPARKELHRQHVAYIKEMRAAGKLVAFGPFIELLRS